jgi:hypothetical protein
MAPKRFGSCLASVGVCGSSACMNTAQAEVGLPDEVDELVAFLQVMLPCTMFCWHPCSWLNHTNTKELPRCKFTDSRQLPGEAAAPPRAAAAAAGVACIGDDGSDEAGAGAGERHIRLIVGPHMWTHTTSTFQHFHVRLTRVQLPLIHAWAITVHKSQVSTHKATQSNSHPSRAASCAVMVALQVCYTQN